MKAQSIDLNGHPLIGMGPVPGAETIGAGWIEAKHVSIKRILQAAFIVILTVVMTSGTIPAGGTAREITENVLLELRTRTTWTESYQRGGFDCSVQSTTLWHILKERGVRTRIAYSLYFDRTLNIQMDHVFLLAEFDGIPCVIDATTLELLDANVRQRGYLVTRVWNDPDEANAEWPGEYVRWDLNRLRKIGTIKEN